MGTSLSLSTPLDRISELPVELLHNILSYLIAPYSGLPGTTGSRHKDYARSMCFIRAAGYPDIIEQHPFHCLSLTSRHMKDVVENFCWHLLKQYQDLGKWEAKLGEVEPGVERANKPKKSNRKVTPYRLIWIKWVKRRCIFCGKVSRRHAIFNNLIHCCTGCDKREWPEKITRTNVLASPYFLTMYDLFYPNPVVPWGSGIWRIKHATYDSMGVDATVFLLEDIHKLVRAVHSDNIEPDSIEKHPDAIEQRKKQASMKNKTGRKLNLKYRGGRWHREVSGGFTPI